MAAQINCVSFNMHGFNQGVQELSCLCESFDVICVQEHWLTADNFSKLKVNDDFVIYATTAMNTKIAKGILSGRPFGGVAILVRKCFALSAKLLFSSDRVIVCSLFELIICNTYLPCTSVVDRIGICADTLSTISICCEEHAASSIIVCGDLNCDFHNSDKVSDILNEFCLSLSLCRTDHMINQVDAFSFHNANYSSTSLIDHFLISNSLISKFSNLRILDSGINFSDHCPIACCLSISCTVPASNESHDCMNECIPNYLKYKLRWDKADLHCYQLSTLKRLSSIKLNNSLITCDSTTAKKHIEDVYHKLVCCITESANGCIPRYKNNFLKVWWDQSLNDAKMASIHAHRAWKELGSPRTGPLFLEMTRARITYKALIKSKDDENHRVFSTELGDLLESQNKNSF